MWGSLLHLRVFDDSDSDLHEYICPYVFLSNFRIQNHFGKKKKNNKPTNKWSDKCTVIRKD